jgi:hypothetical protein
MMNKHKELQAEKGLVRHRVQFDFSPEAYERLTQIKGKSESRTNAEVVRNALRLYDWFLDLKRRKADLQIVENGIVKEVEIFF